MLNTAWAKDRRFQFHVVEITAKQGRRETGGTWTRPDIVVAAMRVFPHVPGKFFDVVTFEIKQIDGIDVTAVFEALAHRRAATQAYLWLYVPSDKETELEEIMERVKEQALHHGIGLIVGADPSDYAQWVTELRAVRFEPDPEALNEFIAQQLTSSSRDELAKWFH